MRKVIFQMMISLDGFFEGPSREIELGIPVDEEFNDYAIDLLNNVDALLFGRVTYELMASYWPSKDATTNDSIVAGKMNSLPKIVFSKTLKQVEWNNSRLVKENIDEEVLKLKAHPGKGLVIFGSSDLALTFIQHDLIDEFRIIVSPIVLGKGKALFQGIRDKLRLKLLRTKIFESGNVLLCYQPVEKKDG